ncbi:MAG TPA: TonB-dependent receptor [Candidatus Dormibacteraeota bacterium]|nr:TonB-dependent receptor [Candidatus Dormibacteraeota bacterium]
MSISGLHAVRFVAVLAAMCSALLLAPVSAQTTATITGVVTGGVGAPIAGASVDLRGVASKTTLTDAQGGYTFANVPPGVYQIVVAKPGFLQYVANVAVVGGSMTAVNIALTPQSFTSLRTIAHISTNAPGHVQINESTASISSVPAETFVDQGQTQVIKVLNEIPGIIVYQAPGANNGADQFAPQTIQIRGALPYETESLIDGHATPLSLTGTFDPSLLNAAMLQNVEVVKGPGSMPEEINYAIGGTVNFITLRPTLMPHASVSTGVDTWGGITTAFRATGSVGNSHFLQYAFAYATDGAPGPMQNYPLAGSAVFLVAGNNWTVNGQQMLSSPVGVALAGPTSYNNYISPVGEIRYAEPFYVCCYPFNTDYDSKNELAKLRLNFSQYSSLTMSFLGGQDFGHTDNTGVAMSNAPVGNLGGAFSHFAPPAGYTGSVPAGTPIPFDLSSFAPGFGSTQQYLYQAEFRTTIGQWTGLLRYYDGGNTNYAYFNNPSSGVFAFTGNAWGGALLCPKGTTFNGAVCNPGGLPPTEQFFNGQRTTFEAQNATNQSLTNNHQRGESLQFDRSFGNGSNVILSVDRTGQAGYEFINVPTSGLPPYYAFPPGASQLFTTESARFDFFIAPLVQASVADYAIQYSSHFTDNGGGIVPGSGPAVWKDATRAYDAPRIAFTWQPNDDTSWRLAAGYSIAPPFLSLLSSQGTAPGENINGLPSAGYTENLNNGDIAPETALGIDLGVDRRFHQSMYVSLDAYLTNLRNMYLPSTFLINQNYFPPSCSAAGLSPGQCPLYGSSVENLGHARYEGIEAAIGNAPARGFGFRLQGTLMRAYAYDLPQGFYCSNVTPSQCTPLHYDTNLGILPGTNFAAGGLGFNTISGAAVPYAMGYGELNWRTANASLYRIGVTYYGNNNAYSEPAFAVLSASIREQLSPHLALVLSGDNLNGVYNQLWANQFGGVGTPLAPECVGKYGGPLFGAYGSVCAAFSGLGKQYYSITSQLGPTGGENYGPTTFRLQLIQQIGGTNP